MKYNAKKEVNKLLDRLETARAKKENGDFSVTFRVARGGIDIVIHETKVQAERM
jgi:hypothetical protein